MAFWNSPGYRFKNCAYAVSLVNMNDLCHIPWNMIYNWVIGFPKSHECTALLGQPMWGPDVTVLLYAKYFFATVAFEFPIYFLLLRNMSHIKKLASIVLVNIATHPFIFLVLPKLMVNTQMSYSAYALIAETFAPLTEGLILSVWLRQGFVRGLAIAIAANLFSWTVGAIVVS